ncbi:bifunctional diaminohydroxyphosphoribosylaminopyrimidine deaminase/5-amino-6-(5-phosphoribosylamino)uracil reductase RibD [Thaumasiovibrio subtropicus]|uniref:bifunctional diaminohydroxyphosphoribosylaminopyrimidine deaminase/5-amino-6-(5-phosphoribosylamino)uracil reductase RibD n=1 Tax=Thaumasiovibrio subtropicus TaxID=1891207 RepID=UPI000B35412F|nr:bifunctional diaminohydroxyphosphoribosylaminopyrimidine deaminase/5-amino-6-(5-phosphoribosylamino)uracil reductase RibD [Thaumasiovibrio subtropicus]
MTSAFTALDKQMMLRALALAERGRYTTSPNPRVGCVIAHGDHIVGEGTHYRAGEPHAEVFALRQAAAKAEGATAYVTLEPCSHYGLTPPCAEALIKAKVDRVVCAMVDPNPQVSGRGLRMLEAAGIATQSGLFEAEALALNPGFIKKMTQNRPFVQLKLAASLDGKTALANGESKWITSAAARQDVQSLRAQADAILSTSGTVLADDPQLNVRWEQLAPSIQAQYPQADLRQPIKVIVDRHQRVTSAHRCTQQGEVRIASQAENPHWRDHPHTSWLALQDDSIESVLAALSRADLNQVFVEAGARFAGELLAAKAVDELILYLAPKLMGGDSRSLIGALNLSAMSDVVDLEIKDLRMVGKDIRIIATPVYSD